MTLSPLPVLLVEPVVRAALLEDLGRAGDITTDAIVPADARARRRSSRASPASSPASTRPRSPSACSIPASWSRSSGPTAAASRPAIVIATVDGRRAAS